MEKKLKSWQGWLLFGGTMVVVFVLGMIAASVNERHAEVTSVMNNKKTEITGIEARNDKFESNYPREYQTWEATADTSFKSLYNGNQAVDVLEARPEMVILWAGYAFSKDYSTPRGHMHAIEDMRNTLRVGAPMTENEGPQPATCWTCKSPDVPRMMQAMGVDNFYKGKWASLGKEIMNPIGCADCHEPAYQSPGFDRGFPASRQGHHESDPARDAFLGLRAMPRGILFQGRWQILDFPLG